MDVLLYRTLNLGDFLTAVPAYRAVARATGRSARVVLAAPAVLAPLVPLVGGIHVLAPTRELEPPVVPGGRVDLAVNLHGRGPQSHLAVASVRPGRLVAYGCEAAGHDGPAWREGDHDVVRWTRLLGESGIRADPHDLHLARPTSRPPRYGAVVVHPGASSQQRRWPEDRFARVVATLQRQGFRVVLTGVASERPLAERIAHRAGLSADAVLAGRLHLGEMAALVASARLVVSGDTGVAHLASAFATPSVVLFGPAAPSAWGPPTSGPHTVLFRAAHDRGRAGSLSAISVSDVLVAAHQRLDDVG